MLVHTGVLPERTEYLERIGPWLECLLAEEEPEDSSVIRAHAQWDVLRRARMMTESHWNCSSGLEDAASR
jgi:hypothetical protein